MGFYKVLSKPMSACAQRYKGLYRSEPFPCSNKCKRFVYLWQKYVQYNDKAMGISTELTTTELKEFANLASQETGECYDLVFFSEYPDCPHKSDYYGLDVVGFGGYSIVGENFFRDTSENGTSNLWYIVSQYFRAKINDNGLFETMEDVNSFLVVLKDLTKLSPGCVEQEEWRIVHVFKVQC
jgi:hypothetical protein